MASNPTKTKKIVDIVVNVVIWLFVVFSLLVTISVFSSLRQEDGIPSLFGVSMFSVQSDSMKPTFKEKDLIFADYVQGDIKAEADGTLSGALTEIKKGDIITFWDSTIIQGQRVPNSHRVVEDPRMEGGTLWFPTRGDNDEMSHGQIRDIIYTDVIGVYRGKLSGMGGVMDFLQSSTGFLVVIVIPLLLFFVYELVNFIITLQKGRQKPVAISAEEQEEIKRRAIEEYLKQQASQAVAPEEKKPDDEPKE